MPEKLPFFNWSIQRVVDLESDPIDKARIRMVIYGLLIGFAITALLIPYYFVFGPTFQLVRSGIMVLVFVALIKLLLAKRIWRQATHIILAVLTVLVLSNIYFKHSVSIITIQYCIIIVMCGFYGLGIRWGIAYSLLNISAVILFLAIDGGRYVPGEVQQLTGRPAFVIVLITNFVLIIAGHYHFYKSFHDNIIQLNKAAQAKSDFLSTMSHELRTPLNSVIGMTNLLLIDNPTEGQKENLKILKFSAEGLLTLINDVLDFNKIESEKIELEQISFNLPELIENIAAAKKIEAAQRGLQFKLETDPMLNGLIVFGDPTRLTQILYNLVTNAIKFTLIGHVKLKAIVTTRSVSTIAVRFSVTDTGIGIPADKHKLIFEPFAQASKNTTRQFGGTGLGLSIVKHLLALSNSEIKMKSAVGVGTEFWFDTEFRLDLNVQPAVQHTDQPAVSVGSFKALVVEDNAMNILLVKKLFAKWWDIQPTIAENGQQAVEMMEYEDFDVVLMDLHMPVMDGYEATRRIRGMARPEKANVYIIALTASVSNNTYAKIKDIGIDDYIHKPFNPDILKSKIEQLYEERLKA